MPFLTFMLGLAFLGSGSAQTRGAAIAKTRMSNWTLERETDRFTGERRCRLVGAGVTIAQGVATFNFGDRVEVENAAYKIDGGAAHVLNSAAMLQDPRVVALRRDAWPDSNTLLSEAENPSHGQVRLPLTMLDDALVVTIRPNIHSNARSFALAGLASALHATRTASCSVEGT